MFDVVKGKAELVHWMDNHQLSTSSIDLNTFKIVNDIKEQIIESKDKFIKYYRFIFY